jgi:hypothetical protein
LGNPSLTKTEKIIHVNNGMISLMELDGSEDHLMYNTNGDLLLGMAVMTPNSQHLVFSARPGENNSPSMYTYDKSNGELKKFDVPANTL